MCRQRATLHLLLTDPRALNGGSSAVTVVGPQFERAAWRPTRQIVFLLPARTLYNHVMLHSTSFVCNIKLKALVNLCHDLPMACHIPLFLDLMFSRRSDILQLG